MATLTVQKITKAAVTPSFVAATGGGDQFPNDGKTMFAVRNGGGSQITVTIVSQQVVDGSLAVADRTFTVAATTGEKWEADLDPAVYNDPGTGRVTVNYSAVTSVTVGVFRLD